MIKIDENDLIERINRSLDKGDIIVRQWAERGEGATTFLVNRTINNALQSKTTMVVLPNGNLLNHFRWNLMAILNENDIVNSFSFESRDVIRVNDYPSIVLCTPDNFIELIHGELFDELLIDDDHLINEEDWEMIYDLSLNSTGRIISLSH